MQCIFYLRLLLTQQTVNIVPTTARFAAQKYAIKIQRLIYQAQKYAISLNAPTRNAMILTLCSTYRKFSAHNQFCSLSLANLAWVQFEVPPQLLLTPPANCSQFSRLVFSHGVGFGFSLTASVVERASARRRRENVA